MESDLYQNWMRDYDPTTGRYMQADPLGLVDGASVYGYALQNPGRYVDPRGEYVWTLPYLRLLGVQLLKRLGPGSAAAIATGPPGREEAQREVLEESGQVCEANDPSCTDHYEQCVGTYLGYRNSGSVWGESACAACFNQCRIDNGYWPDRVLGVDRCDYWNLPNGGFIQQR